MVQSRNRPAPSEWEKIRLELKDMYLGQNLTLKTIEQRFAERGFVATTRQYKTKLKAWGYDDKTIKHPLWHSMYVVMRSRMEAGLTSAFIVPIRGGGTTVIRSDRILKEINRNKSVHDWTNVKRAEEVLQEAEVLFCSDSDREIDHFQQSVRVTKMTKSYGFEPGAQPQGSGSVERRSSSDTINSTSQTGLHGFHSIPGPADFASSNERLAGADRSTSSSHVASTLQSPTSYSLTSVLHTGPRTDYSGLTVASASRSTSNDFDISSVINSLFLDPSSSNPFRAGAPNLLVEEERKLGVQWVAPYICAFLNRKSAENEVNHSNRHGAKEAFKEMLQRNNRYIFPYFNWMFTVLVSNNQTVLLIEFLQDSCEVINQACLGYELTYGPPLQLALAIYTGNENDVEIHRSSFLSSANAIRMIWGSDSPNYLVHQYYYAWLMLERKQYEEALTILHQCLPLSELIMGPQHIITINCLAILARALAKTSREADAMATLHDIIGRLHDCSELLAAFRYRQVMRLAEHQIRQNDLQKAEVNLRDVLSFRSRTFGMNAAATWEAVEKLRDILNLQGRPEESAQLVQQHTSQYDQDREAQWYNRYQIPAPWPRGP